MYRRLSCSHHQLSNFITRGSGGALGGMSDLLGLEAPVERALMLAGPLSEPSSPALNSLVHPLVKKWRGPGCRRVGDTLFAGESIASRPSHTPLPGLGSSRSSSSAIAAGRPPQRLDDDDDDDEHRRARSSRGAGQRRHCESGAAAVWSSARVARNGGAARQPVVFKAAMEREVTKLKALEEEVATSPVAQFVEGDKVEARRPGTFEDADKLYHRAEVVARDRWGAYTLRYDGDGPQEEPTECVPAAWVRPPARRTLLREGAPPPPAAEAASAVVVEDGVGDYGPDDERPLVEVRIMAFEGSRHVVQGACLLEPAGAPRHDFLVLEQCQAMCLGAAMCAAKDAGMDSSDEDARPLACAVVGCGAGSVPAALGRILSPAGRLERLDVVELSQDVADAAVAHFGMLDAAPAAAVHVQEGRAWLEARAAEAPGSYDLLVLDVAGASAPAGDDDDLLTLPPAEFLEPGFLVAVVLGNLRAGGVATLNVIAGRNVLKSLVSRLDSLFTSVHVLATDPNYIFFLSREEGVLTSADVPRLAARVAGLRALAPTALSFVSRTKALKRDKTLIGWYTVLEFLEMLEDEDVIV